MAKVTKRNTFASPREIYDNRKAIQMTNTNTFKHWYPKYASIYESLVRM